jgi:hypothetical protein
MDTRHFYQPRRAVLCDVCAWWSQHASHSHRQYRQYAAHGKNVAGRAAEQQGAVAVPVGLTLQHCRCPAPRANTSQSSRECSAQVGCYPAGSGRDKTWIDIPCSEEPASSKAALASWGRTFGGGGAHCFSVSLSWQWISVKKPRRAPSRQLLYPL